MGAALTAILSGTRVVVLLILLTSINSDIAVNILLSIQVAERLGLTRHLCRDQPEVLAQGYHPRADSVAINAAPSRRE